MRFKSEEQRRAVMAKVRRAKAGVRIGIAKANPAKARLGARTFEALDREDCWRRSSLEVTRGDRDFAAGDWSAACFRYHQAAEQACLGAGAKGRHDIAEFLHTLEAPLPIVQAGGRLNKFYRGDRYGPEREVKTGRVIQPPRIPYSQRLAGAVKEDMQIVVDWCRSKAGAAKAGKN